MGGIRKEQTEVSKGWSNDKMDAILSELKALGVDIVKLSNELRDAQRQAGP
jgi:hypothetical protein